MILPASHASRDRSVMGRMGSGEGDAGSAISLCVPKWDVTQSTQSWKERTPRFTAVLCEFFVLLRELCLKTGCPILHREFRGWGDFSPASHDHPRQVGRAAALRRADH